MGEDGGGFLGPANIETIHDSHGLRFLFIVPETNDLHRVDHNIVGDSPQTEAVLFSWPRNIAERGAGVTTEYSHDFSYVA
jgi:hypothetical protein